MSVKIRLVCFRNSIFEYTETIDDDTVEWIESFVKERVFKKNGMSC